MTNGDERMERNLESRNERMNEQTTDRPTDVCFAGYEEKEVQSDYALVIFNFWDSLSTPLLDRYDIRIKAEKYAHLGIYHNIAPEV